jgi:hypothetical protein
MEGRMDREELKRLTKEEISRRIREGVKAVIEQVLEEDWTYAASTCTGNRGLKSRLSLPAMSLRRHW